MKVEGTYTFSAPRDLVWQMLQDPQVLTSVLPGCEKLNKTGDNEYQGALMIRIGPVQGKFNGTVTMSDINRPESYNLTVDGKGAPGFVKGAGALHLAAENGKTLLTYEGDAQVGGRIASVGQRLLDTSARAIIRQSLEGLDQQINARQQAGDAPDTPPPPPPAPPSQTQFALGVARNFMEELVPPDKQGEVINKAVWLMGGLLLLRLLSEWWMNRLAKKIAKRIKAQ